MMVLLTLFVPGCGGDDIGEGKNETNTNMEVSEDLLSKDKTIARIKSDYGIDVSEYCSDAKGAEQKNYFFAEVEISDDKTTEMRKVLSDKYGSGRGPGSVTLPKFKNQICDNLREKNVILVYDKINAGNPNSNLLDQRIFLVEDGSHTFVYFIF